MDDAAFEARLLDECLLCAIGNGPPKKNGTAILSFTVKFRRYRGSHHCVRREAQLNKSLIGSSPRPASE